MLYQLFCLKKVELRHLLEEFCLDLGDLPWWGDEEAERLFCWSFLLLPISVSNKTPAIFCLLSFSYFRFHFQHSLFPAFIRPRLLLFWKFSFWSHFLISISLHLRKNALWQIHSGTRNLVKKRADFLSPLSPESPRTFSNLPPHSF